MAQLAMQRSYDAPAAVVWDVVTDHDLYGTVAPNLADVEVVRGGEGAGGSGDGGTTDGSVGGEGMVRRCVDTDGNEWTETCLRWDDGRAFEMAVDVANSDFHRRLFDRFEGRWSVTDREADVLVTVAFAFETRYGPLGWPLAKYFEYRAPALVEPVFDGWAAAVENRRGGGGTGVGADGRVPADGGP